jgi:hypothetical protein
MHCHARARTSVSRADRSWAGASAAIALGFWSAMVDIMVWCGVIDARCEKSQCQWWVLEEFSNLWCGGREEKEG